MNKIKLPQTNEEYFLKAGKIIFDNNSSFEALQNAVRAYHGICCRITGICGAIEDKQQRYETQLPTGFALSPGYAADCTLDTWRTVKYLRALRAGVLAFREKNPGRPVHVLYAGCGPFAPFAVLLSRVFKAEEVTFTLLDLHENALEAVKKIVKEFSLEDFFNAYIPCDATEYTLQGERPQILVTETMHRTLSREPHVMITRNLAPQLAAEGIVIPRKVAIRACLTDMEDEHRSYRNKLSIEENASRRIDLGVIFEVTKDTEYRFAGDENFFRGRSITIDEKIHEKDTIALLTEITLFGDITLKERESGITFPHYALDLERLNPGDSIDFLFQAKGLPGIQYKVCSELII